VVIAESSIFWNMMPCSQLKMNWCFGGTSCLHLQERRVSQGRNQCEAGIKLAMLILDPEDGGDILLNSPLIFTALYPRRRNFSVFCISLYIFPQITAVFQLFLVSHILWSLFPLLFHFSIGFAMVWHSSKISSEPVYQYITHWCFFLNVIIVNIIVLYCIVFLLLPFLLEHRASVKHCFTSVS
jgi:hypothetical protein